MQVSVKKATVTAVIAVLSTFANADVASRVQESGSTSHVGVLAYVHSNDKQHMATEKMFFGSGLKAISESAHGFQIQIVEPMDIPGGALPGSFVVLTPSGNRVVALQRGYTRWNDLRAFVATANDALMTYSALNALPPIAVNTGSDSGNRIASTTSQPKKQ